MTQKLNHSPVEKVAHLRDEILQKFFLKQMKSIYTDWKFEVKQKIDAHYNNQNNSGSTPNTRTGGANNRQQNTRTAPPITNYRNVNRKIRRFGLNSLKIEHFDTTVLSSLITYDFLNDFKIDNTFACINHVEEIRDGRNSKHHFADHNDVLTARSDAAYALVKLKEFLNYLAVSWQHPDAADFTDKYLKIIDALEAELFNEESPNGPDYKELSFEKLQEMVDENIPEAQNEMAIRLYGNTLEEDEYGEGKATELFKAAADAGIAEAMAHLAHIKLKKRTAERAEIKEAFALLAKAESLGCPYAHYVYGIIAFDGLGGERKDLKEAYKEFSKGAELGCTEAMLYKVYCEATENNPDKISLAYLSKIENIANDADSGFAYNFAGWCYTRNKQYEDAFDLYRKAADKGYIVAETNLGKCYLNGNGVAEDPYRAFALFKSAAYRGHTPAKYSLALRYYYGSGTNEDKPKAFKMFIELLKEGYTPVKSALAECYYYGYGTNKSERGAFMLAKAAVEENEADRFANYILGLCYYDGLGTDKNPTLAFEHLKKSADIGYREAEFKVGCCYHKGIGAAKDPILAFKYWKSAADKGHTVAENNVGACYENGIGTDKKPLEAFKYYKSAADKEYSQAEYAVGRIYKYGIEAKPQETRREDKRLAVTPAVYHIEPDEEEALKYFRRAANKNHTKAEYEVGVAFYNKGSFSASTPPNLFGEDYAKKQREKSEQYYAVAFSFLKRAADKGHKSAQYYLAKCYQGGHGADKNLPLALSLFEKVALSEDTYADMAKDAFADMIYVDEFRSRIEDVCLKNKWFELLTKKYLDRLDFYRSPNDKVYSRVITWLNKAGIAGYAAAAEKKEEANWKYEQAKSSANLSELRSKIITLTPDEIRKLKENSQP